MEAANQEAREEIKQDARASQIDAVHTMENPKPYVRMLEVIENNVHLIHLQ